MSNKYLKMAKKIPSAVLISFIAVGCGNDRGDSSIPSLGNLGDIDKNITKKVEFKESDLEDINITEIIEKIDANESFNLYDLPVVKTGQIESFNKYDDGYYEKGVDRDFIRDNEIVKDKMTRLEWLDNEEVINAKDFSEASSYCANLIHNGSGWRIPNIKELQSIAYDGDMFKNINPIFEFIALGESKYWSSTKYSNPDYQDSLVWQMHYRDGAVRTVYKSNNTTDMYVRCVRNF